MIRTRHIHTPPIEPGYPADFWWLQAECGCVWRRGDEDALWWMHYPIVLRGKDCPWLEVGHPKREIDIEGALYTPCERCPRDIGSRFRHIPHPLDPPRPTPAPAPSHTSPRIWGGVKTALGVVGAMIVSFLVFVSCGGSGIPGWGP